MDVEDKVLIITDSISISAALVFWVFKNFSVQLQNLSIITQASLLEDNMFFKAGSVSSVISISAKAGFHTQLWLKEMAKLLKPDGFLLVQEPSYLNHNNQLMLGDSKASLERNLLFVGFHSVEGFECLKLYDETCFDSSHFELITMKAKKASLTEAVRNLSKPESIPTEKTSTGCRDKEPKEAEKPRENLPNEGSLVAPKRTRMPTSIPDVNVDVKEKIRERNRLYQRRRRERMSEEEKNNEREKRKLYMQRRRIRQLTGSVDEPQSVD